MLKTHKKFNLEMNLCINKKKSIVFTYSSENEHVII